MGTSDESPVAGIDGALAAWRQGDCVLGEHWFAFRIAVGRPLTESAHTAAAEEVDLAEEAVRGLMVATQTCDIARSCGDRPFVEVCPLVGVPTEFLPDINGGRRPRYAYIPGIAGRTWTAP